MQAQVQMLRGTAGLLLLRAGPSDRLLAPLFPRIVADSGRWPVFVVVLGLKDPCRARKAGRAPGDGWADAGVHGEVPSHLRADAGDPDRAPAQADEA